jgi:hypothetical protein
VHSLVFADWDHSDQELSELVIFCWNALMNDSNILARSSSLIDPLFAEVFVVDLGTVAVERLDVDPIVNGVPWRTYQAAS